MNLMEPNDSYTRSDQTPLQLVYDIKWTYKKPKL